jgi:integrating conjugative element protein (TIGR03759 family)
MDSPAGLYYKRGEANPYFVLSAEAKTEAERMKYARLWVKAEKGFLDKVGDAMRAYSKASVEEFGANPKIWDLTSYDKLVNGFNQQTKQNQSRAMLFVRSENCSDCVERFNQLNKQLAIGILSGIDVFFADAKGKADAPIINKWAAAQHIDPDVVVSKKITLNYAVDFMPKDLPSVMLK